MVTHDFHEVERVARNICEARNGLGSYDAKNRKRAWYRDAAIKVIAAAKRCGYTGPIYFQMRDAK